jgi:hypothetical protein
MLIIVLSFFIKLSINKYLIVLNLIFYYQISKFYFSIEKLRNSLNESFSSEFISISLNKIIQFLINKILGFVTFSNSINV